MVACAGNEQVTCERFAARFERHASLVDREASGRLG
jgi:hypothetical protein